jgi:hypothetical protein
VLQRYYRKNHQVDQASQFDVDPVMEQLKEVQAKYDCIEETREGDKLKIAAHEKTIWTQKKQLEKHRDEIKQFHLQTKALEDEDQRLQAKFLQCEIQERDQQEKIDNYRQ